LTSFEELDKRRDEENNKICHLQQVWKLVGAGSNIDFEHRRDLTSWKYSIICLAQVADGKMERELIQPAVL
jgi:hypothetical protein